MSAFPSRPILLAALALLAICVRPGTASPTYKETLLQEGLTRKLAEDPYWHHLLHYHRNLWGRYQSEIDDKKFFLSKRGRRDPAAELDSTVEAFFDPLPADPETQHPQCRYPARYAWLKSQLHFDARLPDQPCERFDKWRHEMDPQSVTLVFASYYLNNPASMYGHTFLRLNSKQRTEKDRLLDYTVNFAAYTDSTNGLLFAIQGLGGGYRGRFSTMPYYLKVQEYNNLESRDLWEYRLNLDPDSVDRLVRHLWEMGQGSIAYFFFNKNCSYQLLPLLEVAQPSLHLVDSFWLKAIPADTLRSVIQQPGLLGDVRLRPSHVTKMLAARATLSPDEVRVAETLARKADEANLEQLNPFPKDRHAKVLDSAFDLFRYRAGFHRDQPESVQAQERRLLLARNRLPPAPLEPVAASTAIPPTIGSTGAASPDQGHATGRVGLSWGLNRKTNFEEISLRPALHDQADPVRGYIEGSQLEMLHLRARYDNPRKTFYLQEFTLVDITSLSPWDRWVRKPSWNVRTGLSVADELEEAPEDSLYYGLNTGPGFAYKSRLWRGEMWYALAQADLGLGGVFEDDYRIGGGITLGLSAEIASWWKVHFQATYFDYAFGDRREAVKLRVIQAFPLGRAMQVRMTLQRQNHHQEMLFTWQRYL